jgi:H+/Cl- antiporter ClcA
MTPAPAVLRFPGLRLPPRWARKVVKLRHWILMAVPIGLLTGLGVSALETLCNRVLWWHIAAAAVPWRLLAPILGLSISGWILARLNQRSIAMLNEVVLDYHHPPDAIQPKRDLLAMAATVSTVGLGASLSLGGPSQWLGTRLACYLRHHLRRIRPMQGLSQRQVLMVGAAAGVAAYLRAPLTGTILAMETPFRRDLDATAFLPASLAALLAFWVHGLLVGSSCPLPFTNVGLGGWRALLGSAAIGLAAGILSRCFQRGALWARAATDPLPWQLRGPLGGMVVAATAWLAWCWFGDTWTLQTGLPMARQMFAGHFHGWAPLVLLVLKLVAVCATLGTTGVAGVLVITLTVGTVLGAVLQPFLPFGLDLACAVAVCAYLAANYNAPLTGVALALEWGGVALLHSVWPAVILAAWIGSGLANTPAKTRHSRQRPPARPRPPQPPPPMAGAYSHRPGPS